MTQDHFRQDAYQSEYKARGEAMQTLPLGEMVVIQDRTVFYPLGGGQAGDAGWLVLPDGGEVSVADTRKAKDALTAGIAALVSQTQPVTLSNITEDELDANPALVRRMSVRPARGSAVIRSIRMGAEALIQPQSCGGMHVANTSEIGDACVMKIEKKSATARGVRIFFMTLESRFPSFLAFLGWCFALILFLGVTRPVNAQSPLISPWYTAARLPSGVVMDPMMPLAACEVQAGRAMAQRQEAMAERLRADPGYWPLHPLSIPKSATHSAALMALMQAPMWLVEEKGSRPVQLTQLTGAVVMSNGPCLHLSNFELPQARRFALTDDSDVLISTRPLSANTRLVRARQAPHQAFASNETPVRLERPLAAWFSTQPELMQAFSKDVPKPNDALDREICIPSHQPFSATLDGALRPLLSLRLQWCECEQREAGVCRKMADPRGKQAQWLAVVERRTGAIWHSSVSKADGLQFMSVIALATGGDLKDDVIWLLEEHAQGVQSSVLLREGRQLKRQAISTYSGL